MVVTVSAWRDNVRESVPEAQADGKLICGLITATISEKRLMINNPEMIAADFDVWLLFQKFGFERQASTLLPGRTEERTAFCSSSCF